MTNSSTGFGTPAVQRGHTHTHTHKGPLTCTSSYIHDCTCTSVNTHTHINTPVGKKKKRKNPPPHSQTHTHTHTAAKRGAVIFSNAIGSGGRASERCQRPHNIRASAPCLSHNPPLHGAANPLSDRKNSLFWRRFSIRAVRRRRCCCCCCSC